MKKLQPIEQTSIGSTRPTFVISGWFSAGVSPPISIRLTHTIIVGGQRRSRNHTPRSKTPEHPSRFESVVRAANAFFPRELRLNRSTACSREKKPTRSNDSKTCGGFNTNAACTHA